MAKVLEGPGMGLLSKWGISTPHFVVITAPDQLDRLASANLWLSRPGAKIVVKAHEAIGSRMKLGLVKVGLNLSEAKAASAEMLGKKIGTLTISQVILSEFVEHDAEHYLAVKSVREGAEILMASVGGIEIESRWDQVKRLLIPLDQEPTRDQLESLAKEAGFRPAEVPSAADFALKLYQCYDQEDGTYMEINPLIRSQEGQDGKGAGEWIALDAVMMLDMDARFRHPDWNFTFASEFGRPYTDSERAIMEIDSKIKGSVKFIEIPGGDTALLPAGGGASVFYADAVIALGGKISNYAEYSGDPPDWAVEALTERVCALKGIRRIIVGGAIANFTDVKKTFGGIINGFRKAKAEGRLEGVSIWVRRGGPNEKEGLDAMRALAVEGFDIYVYDRNMPLTDIVNMALERIAG